MEEWERLAGWWLGEVADDPAYRDDVSPLLAGVFEAPAGVVLDVGCGNGRIMRDLDRPVVGTDIAEVLLREAAAVGPVVRSRLPSLRWLASASVAGIVAVMVLEHVADLETLFAETARVSVIGGTFTTAMNHPAFTAPGSGPIVDQSDGEVLWRWGPYFTAAEVREPAGTDVVTFHHRPLDALLTTAATSGWALETMQERPLSPSTIARLPSLVGQEHFPRLLGLRWRRRLRREDRGV